MQQEPSPKTVTSQNSEDSQPQPEDGSLNLTVPSSEEKLIPPTTDPEDVPEEDIQLPAKVDDNLDAAEIDDAAEELGMTKLRLGSLRKYAEIGKALEIVGAIPVATGVFLAGVDARELGIEKMQERLREEETTEGLCMAAQTLNLLVSSRDKSAKELATLVLQGKISDPSNQGKNKVRPKGDKYNITADKVAIQNNISGE